MIKKIYGVFFLMSFVLPSLADQHKADSVLQDAVIGTLQALACWKQEVQDESQLVDLLDQVEAKITDPNTTQVEIGLYGVLLHRIRLLPLEKQLTLINSLLSKTSDELMREAAVLVQVFRSAQHKDSEQQ